MPDSPLKAMLARDAAQTRKALDQPTFTRQDYARLHELALSALARLAAFPLPPGNRLARCERTFRDLLAIAEDQHASVILPREGEIYAAGLETGQLSQIISALVTPRARSASVWGQRILAALDPECDAITLLDRRFRLQFIAMCVDAGVRVEPSTGDLDAECGLGKWRIGLACKRIETENLIDAAVASAGARLKRARLPGLIALEVSGIVWPERRVLAVDSDLTAARELHKRTDAFLVEHADAIARIIDPSYVFGVLAAATIPSLNVTTRHVAFSSSFRIASLVPESDPRHAHLVSFVRKFETLG